MAFIRPERFLAALVAGLLIVSSLAEARARQAAPAHQSETGILLLAHGGKANWNAEVMKIAAAIDREMPVEVAFGMASKPSIQAAVDRLVARGVAEIVAVPLFISSHSSIITSTEYLLGLRAEAPKELAAYARMDHRHGEHGGHHAASDPSFDPTTPVKSPVPIRMTRALDRHPLVAEILMARAESLSQNPPQEVVVVVAHGPVTDAENAAWLADMEALVGRMRNARRFHRVEYLTLRDDAPEPIRSRATAELRAIVERAMNENRRVLIVPLLLAYGGIEEGIKKRLEGLRYEMCRQGLLPDERLARWVRLMADSAISRQ